MTTPEIPTVGEMDSKLQALGHVRPWNWLAESEATRAYRANLMVMESPSETARQIALEQLTVMHSIRRILFWTLVVIPLALVALCVVLGVVIGTSGSSGSSSSSGSYCSGSSIYSRC
jgi:hypothetical protein